MDKNNLLELCVQKMKEKNIFNEQHKTRLELECKEIGKANEYEYFIKLHKENKKFAKNENNILIPYLLNIVQDFDINKQPKYDYGEYPDIDVDFIDGVRQY